MNTKIVGIISIVAIILSVIAICISLNAQQINPTTTQPTLTPMPTITPEFITIFNVSFPCGTISKTTVENVSTYTFINKKIIVFYNSTNAINSALVNGTPINATVGTKFNKLVLAYDWQLNATYTITLTLGNTTATATATATLKTAYVG